ncbi:unnamed protein product [marine sediment metagenome]|uniref:Uncharacterized protein n=1 Tax=marine sediment metagenome TaxID=412755 RepID=X0ZTC8_9ZZZZ
MISVTKILAFVSMWIVFGGLLALAIIFDGIYIQLVFDLGIIVVSGLLGYYLKAKSSKE